MSRIPKGHALDPKGLIAESYRIEGIGKPECRSIFLDWALSLPLDCDNAAAIRAVLDQHGGPGHPMTEVLNEGLAGMSAPRRRGGWRARNRTN